jgi:myo-inositol-1(or 4)-monophosphatase
VAAGKLDGYWEFRLRSWDTAAGTLVAREAGVTVTGIDGVELPLHWEHILAAPPDLHREMAAVLAAAGEPA